MKYFFPIKQKLLFIIIPLQHYLVEVQPFIALQIQSDQIPQNF
jgi:hypothetical protein